MNQLLHCVKKEFLQGFRKGKFWILLAVAVGFVLLNMITFYAMEAMLRMEGLGDMQGMEQMLAMFSKTVRNGTMFYLQYLNTYYILVVIFLFMGSCAKEIKNRQWLLPVSSGIRSSNIVLAKFIAICLATVLAALVGFMVNTLLCAALFDNSGAAALQAKDLLLIFAAVAVQILFYTVLTVAVSAISKRGWVAALVSAVFLILVTSLFAQFDFANYTVLVFNNVLTTLSGAGVSAAQWTVAAVTTFVVLAALIYAAAFGVHHLKLRYEK